LLILEIQRIFELEENKSVSIQNALLDNVFVKGWFKLSLRQAFTILSIGYMAPCCDTNSND